MANLEYNILNFSISFFQESILAMTYTEL